MTPMPRPKRIQFPEAFFHVFNRGIKKKTVYFSEYNVDYFLEILEQAWIKYNFSIHSFCLMKNHFHLLIQIHDTCLSNVMQYLISRFSRTLNNEINADGAVFRDRFKSILVDSSQYLLQVSRYIHLNPVVAQLVEFPQDYKWSSYVDYMTNNSRYDFLSKSYILSHFKEKEEFISYHKFGVDKVTSEFYKKKHISSILGSESYKKKIRSKYMT